MRRKESERRNKDDSKKEDLTRGQRTKGTCRNRLIEFTKVWRFRELRNFCLREFTTRGMEGTVQIENEGLILIRTTRPRVITVPRRVGVDPDY